MSDKEYRLMRLSAKLIIAATFLIAAVASLIAAGFSVSLIEDNSEISVRDELDARNMPWAEVEADGLKVILSGMAPTEALRFKALSTAGGIVDAARVIDEMQVQAVADLAPPRFSAEILRNDSGISVIGLVPAQTDREALIQEFQEIAGESTVTDLLETADYAVPKGWEDALAYGLSALRKLPRSKVSIDAGRVAITAISDSPEAKAKLETALTRAAPPGLRLNLSISAPRPVITPFTLRFLIDESGPQFDACSADTEAAQTRILKAARAAGLSEDASCTIGLGVPSPKWADAVVASITAIDTLQSGSVTFADADVTLVAAEGTDQRIFDRVIGDLENALPDAFVLHAVLPDQKDPTQGPPEFVATLSPEGLVQLRGRLTDENLQQVVQSYAQARFGSENVYLGARVAEGLPANWPTRVLTGLEALSALSNGAVTVTPDSLTVQGNTGNPEARAYIAKLLAGKLGDAENFEIKVTYQKKLDPVASLPTPDECEAEIAAILKVSKINFEPGSATIDAGATATLDDIAEVLKKCGDIRMEIQGHTDSQGREIMNEQLSQSRAQSVLNELRARRVLTSSFNAKGYGEAQPIADNKTEEGREANRRIEFVLIRPKPIEELETTLDSIAEPAAEEGQTDEQN